MFKKKESKLPYFFGGTAIGMAAGLLVGKLLSNTSTAESQNIELKPSSCERVIKYSLDDDIQNLHLHKNINSCTCSKSMSQYENKSCKEESASKVSFIKLDNTFKDNINDLASDKKYSPNFSKIVFDDVDQLHNISIEDNVEYNTTDEVFLDFKEDKVCNTDHLFEFENMRNKILINGTTGYNNLQKVDNSAMNQNTLKSCTENDINLITYNSMLQSVSDKKNETSYCTTLDDFNETQLISSTKVNDSDYMEKLV